MNCNIIEWGGGPLGPEAMFFKPNGGAEFEIWAVSRDDHDDEDVRPKKAFIKLQINHYKVLNLDQNISVGLP